MWTVRDEPAEHPDVTALIRDYFAELTVRYFKRATDEAEIDLTLEEFPSTGLAAFFVLRSEGAPAGCLGLYPTGELTRVFVVPEHRRGGGGRALLAAAESTAIARGLTRLFLDTRHDLVEARSLYTATGFAEVPPFTAPGPFKDHWFEKHL